MDWKHWENHRAGGAKLSLEEAEQYVSELLLSRSMALPAKDENEALLYSPGSLQGVSRSRRVIQTLGMIVRSCHLEYYYQAVYLLQFLHNLYPEAVSVQEYAELLVYLKVEAVIFVACCSMASNRVQAAHCLMKQLFDDCDYESCSVADKQHLEKVHNDGCAKLSQILASSNKLCLNNLSAEHPPTQEHHKAMCKILEGFFKGIDDVLPAPTIIQLIQDFQEQQKSMQRTSAKNLASKTTYIYVTPELKFTSKQVYVERPSPPKQFADTTSSKSVDSPVITADSPKTTDSPSVIVDSPTTDSFMVIADPPDSLEMSPVTTDSSEITADSPKTSQKITASSKTADSTRTVDSSKTTSPPKMTSLNDVHHLTQDGSQSKTSNNTTKDNKSKDRIGDNTSNAAGEVSVSSALTELLIDNPPQVKFVSTHSSMKRISPLPMKCQRNTKSNGSGKTQPKVKRVRIVLTPLSGEKYYKQENTSILQQKESIYKKSGMSDLASTNNSSLTHSTNNNDENDDEYQPSTNGSSSTHSSNVNDEDYQPSSNSDKIVTVTRTRRKRKIVTPVRYAPFKGYQRDPQNHDREECVTVRRTKRKRKSVLPIRYTPFTEQDLQNYDSEQLCTSGSESVISESVASSIISDPPLVINLQS